MATGARGGTDNMTDIWVFTGLNTIGVLIVCALLFFVGIFAMVTVVAIAETIRDIIVAYVTKKKGEES
jgi:uncharacterized membrane protein YqiK